jgi:hypothetical protein
MGPMATLPFHAKRWSRLEYDRLVEIGFFDLLP